jgi:hypothetical protein
LYSICRHWGGIAVFSCVGEVLDHYAFA